MTMDPHAGGELTDDALQDEIELVGDLVVAASASKQALTDEEIDRILGVKRGHGARRAQARADRSRNWRRQEA
jgi:hypothetical protein